MPKDISSSSSSEDEDHSPDAQPNQELTERTSTRYQCPADFVSFSYKPCSSTLKSNNNNELWLIKAPSSFNPQSFSGVQLPLCGLQTVTAPSAEGKAHIYSVLGSSRCSPELRLLTPHQHPFHTTLAPPFSGLINICESYGDSSANQAPQVISSTPAPTLPPGLKQRFQHFGSRTTAITTQSGEGEKGKRMRKRKKEKRIKTEPEEVSVREELAGLQRQLLMDREVSEESRKRKKKKEREGQSEEWGLQATTPTQGFIKTEVMVKNEPLYTVFGDEVEGRKKKKKKSKSAD